MKTQRGMLTSLLVLLALAACSPGEDGAGSGLQPDGGDPGDAPGGGNPPPAEQALRVAFKLDRRLTSGLYLGDRWVAPDTFHAPAQTGDDFDVEARVELLSSGASPTVSWTPSDPGAVAVAPADVREVVITVFRPGVSTLVVTVDGKSTAVSIEADHTDGTWFVTFRQ